MNSFNSLQTFMNNTYNTNTNQSTINIFHISNAFTSTTVNAYIYLIDTTPTALSNTYTMVYNSVTYNIDTSYNLSNLSYNTPYIITINYINSGVSTSVDYQFTTILKPVTYYKFEKYSGYSIFDEITQAYNGVPSPSTNETGSYGPATQINSYFNNCSYLLKNSFYSKAYTLSSTFSVCFYFNVTKYNNTDTPLFCLKNNINRIIVLQITNENQGRKLFYGYYNNVNDTGTSTNTINLNTWYHVVWTISNYTSWKLYINGTLVNTTTIAGYITGYSYTDINQFGINTVNYMNGQSIYYDEFLLFNSVLSSSNITTIYKKGKYPA